MVVTMVFLKLQSVSHHLFIYFSIPMALASWVVYNKLNTLRSKELIWQLHAVHLQGLS